MKFFRNPLLLAAAALVCAAAPVAAEPIRLHPENPHYFLFRGKPTVLITSGEHYGAVLNGRFDYRKYLDELAAHKLNLTRLFGGTYREVPGSFNITGNVLAPEEADYVQPYRRVGPRRYDLSQWNPEFFRRLRDFVSEADKRGVVVEMNLFTSYYGDAQWTVSPYHIKNNIQGVGGVKSDEVLTLKDPALTQLQEDFVRKVARELNEFENLYYEICNEPYIHGPTVEWQRRMTDVLVETEKALPRKHLISWNIANRKAEVKEPHPAVSLFNFHYARPPVTVEMNYALNRAIGNNETGFDGGHDSVYRVQGWEFMLAGGALYNNLDYSFTVGHEDGSFAVPWTNPGGGSRELRRQLGILREFMDSLPFVKMKPSPQVVTGGVPTGATAYALAQDGAVYAVYVHHGREMNGYEPSYVVGKSKTVAKLRMELPAGDYEVRWWDTRRGSGAVAAFTHAGGSYTLPTPEYTQDIAVVIRRK